MCFFVAGQQVFVRESLESTRHRLIDVIRLIERLRSSTVIRGCESLGLFDQDRGLKRSMVYCKIEFRSLKKRCGELFRLSAAQCLNDSLNDFSDCWNLSKRGLIV